jgi:hypothetical protein
MRNILTGLATRRMAEPCSFSYLRRPAVRLSRVYLGTYLGEEITSRIQRYLRSIKAAKSNRSAYTKPRDDAASREKTFQSLCPLFFWQRGRVYIARRYTPPSLLMGC